VILAVAWWWHLAVSTSKQPKHKFHMERFNQELNEVEGEEHVSRITYHVKTSNMFAALEKLDDEMGIHRAWKISRKNIKVSVKERLG
jgi:hypothetical protein